MSNIPGSEFGLSTQEMSLIHDIVASAGPELERVAVFGSRAQNNFRPNSDLDLVLYGNLSQKTVDHLSTLFADSSLPFSVDLKCYDTLTYLPLRQHIDKVAKTLFITRSS